MDSSATYFYRSRVEMFLFSFLLLLSSPFLSYFLSSFLFSLLHSSLIYFFIFPFFFIYPILRSLSFTTHPTTGKETRAKLFKRTGNIACLKMTVQELPGVCLPTLKFDCKEQKQKHRKEHSRGEW